jgi:hypothetical protein
MATPNVPQECADGNRQKVDLKDAKAQRKKREGKIPPRFFGFKTAWRSSRPGG